jgi:hypothetical protein
MTFRQSLFMAGAMVSTMSVSAYAATDTTARGLAIQAKQAATSASSSDISTRPAATTLSAGDLIACQQGSVSTKCTVSQQSNYTLSSGITTLPAAGALTGAEVSNIIQGTTPSRLTVSQLASYAQSGSPTLRQVGKRTFVADSIAPATTQGMCRIAQIAGENLTQLQLVFSNFYVSTTAEVNPGAPRTVTASIEYPSGTYNQVLFSGNATGSMTDGQAQLVSDVKTISIPQGATYWVDSYQVSSAGTLGVTAAVRTSSALGDQCTVGTSVPDSTMTGFTGSVSTAPYGPTAIIAPSIIPAVAAPDDSIEQGTGNIGGGGTVWAGFLAPALAPRFGYMSLSRQSFTAQAAANGQFAKRATFFQYATSAVLELGSNDFAAAARTYTQLKADRYTIRGFAPNLHWFETTILPRPTSTTAFTTLQGQTFPSWEATNRVPFNELVRAGDLGFEGFFDIAACAEPATNVGKWIIPNSARTLTDVTTTAGSTTITSATGGFSNGDISNGFVLTGAGASGADLVGFASYSSGSTTLVLQTAPSVSLTNATMRIGSATADGAHPAGVFYNNFRQCINPNIIK